MERPDQPTWRPESIEQIDVRVDRSTSNHFYLRAGRDRAWTHLRNVCVKLKRAGYDGVVVCFDSNKKRVYYDANKPHWNFRSAATNVARKHRIITVSQFLRLAFYS